MMVTVLASAAVPAKEKADWGRRNLRLLSVFAPVLIATGLVGLLLPPGLSMMSSATSYDVFHLSFGVLGLGILLGRSARSAALFNLGFGAIDLYQALAGVTGLFPAELFALRPADHLVHLLLGSLLVAFGLHRPSAPPKSLSGRV